MIRQQAFWGNGKFLKGGLHCHTKRSDGCLTPEQIMTIYKEHGYDFLAITDHRKYNSKNHLPELGLTIIPGMEFDNGPQIPSSNGFRCFHTVCLGPTEGNGFNHDDAFPAAPAKNQEEYQPFLDDIHSKNNLTILCHPQWSSTPPRYFEKQQGNFAMEVFNTGSSTRDMDLDAVYWDEILGQGIKIYGVAADDAHSIPHCGKGWVMVNSENDVESILAALQEGRFYSTCGPEIYDFYVKDNVVVIDCSPTAKIRLHADKHPTRICHSADILLTHAEFELDDLAGSFDHDWTGAYDYVRISVVDKNGKMAWTNPIFLI